MSDGLEGSADQLRLLEALLFAASEPQTVREIEAQFPMIEDVAGRLDELQRLYQGRGVELRQIGDGWAFRTAADLSPLMTRYRDVKRKLSKAALETLAIIAYHQPVTRAEIEDVRGVQTSKGTLDVLLETNWVKMRGRRRAPGRPITYGTTQLFLDQFDLARITDLPGVKELKGAGLLDGALPPDFAIPSPHDGDEPGPGEDLLSPDDELFESDIAGEEDPLRFKQDDYFEDEDR